MRAGRPHRRRDATRATGRLAVVAVGAAIGTLVAPVASGASPPTKDPAASASTPITVVAAENFWGSIVKQLAGSRARVVSIITNPATDPHSYEAKPSDSRTLAEARYVIANGIGYDPWIQKALDANPSSGRKVLVVGDLLGLHEGDNPHQWYSVASVNRFILQVTSDLSALDRRDATYFASQRTKFILEGLTLYHDLVTNIRIRYAGTPVGASESIFAPLADSLALRLVTPPSFLKAIAEGTDPTAADKATVDRQITNKQIKVFVLNAQNSTPDVQTIVGQAKARHIPVVTVTETLTPASATFQAWQAKELAALQAALAKATGK